MRRLSMSERAIYDATKDARKAEKQTMMDRAIGMWLDCHTQEALADAVGVDQGSRRTAASSLSCLRKRSRRKAAFLCDGAGARISLSG